MQYTYRTKGTCSQMISFEVEDNKLSNVQFFGGCNGNLKGIGALVEGMDIDDVIARVSAKAATAVHLDTDEANAAGISGTVEGEIIL